MTRLQSLFIWFYAQCLALYPGEFYQQFADEMLEVLHDKLEASGFSLRLVAHEFGGLLASISRERRRTQQSYLHLPLWYISGLLMIPVVLCLFALGYRSVHLFFLPGKTWWILALVTALMAVLGWASGRRWAVFALPVGGVMFSIGLRLVWRGIAPLYRTPWFNPIGFNVWWHVLWFLGMILLLVVATVGLKQMSFKRWIGYVALMPVIGLVTAATVVWLQPITFDSLSLSRFWREYFLGTVLMMGTMGLLFIVAYGFAHWFGKKAVVLITGFMFAEMAGLVATVSPVTLQRPLGMVFVLIFLGITPVVVLYAERAKRWHVLVPVLTGYLLFFVVKFVSEGYVLDPVFLLYRSNEMLQAMLVLAIAVECLPPARIQRKKKKAHTTDTQMETASE